MKRHGPHEADVKNATTALCEANSDWNEAKFVEICIGETTEDSPEDGSPGRRSGGDRVAPSATDRNDDVATWVVLWPGCETNPAVCPEYMRSIVGRSARPKSVERKSDGRSGLYFIESAYIVKKSYNHTFDPRRYRPSCEETDTITCKRITVEVYSGNSAGCDSSLFRFLGTK